MSPWVSREQLPCLLLLASGVVVVFNIQCCTNYICSLLFPSLCYLVLVARVVLWFFLVILACSALLVSGPLFLFTRRPINTQPIQLQMTPIHKSNFFLPPHNFLSIFCENIFQYECYILFLIKLCLEVVLENFSEFLGAISQVYFPFVLWILQLCLAKTLCVLGCYGSNKCLVINSIFYHLNLRYLLEF